MSKAEALLGPRGPLARLHDAYEVRPGQLQMAASVERCLADGHVLICEAGTGTGKTLAYLVPAVLSGKKVVISTATRALQDQIFDHDIPLVERTLGVPVDAALMKGLGNYVCRRRYRELVLGSAADLAQHREKLPQLREWVNSTGSGDIAELEHLSDGDPVLAAVVSSADTRIGAACEHFGECFVTRMRRRAEQATIIVVNHHLLCADLALRGPHPGRVIPDHDVLIFDEAHQLEDVATQFFGARLTSASLVRFFSEAARHLEAITELDLNVQLARRTLFEQASMNLDDLGRELRKSVNAAPGRFALPKEHWVGNLRECWFRMDHTLEMIELEALTARGRLAGAPRQELRGATDVLELDARRAKSLRERLALLVEGESGVVSWLESNARGFVLSASPIELSRVLRDSVFETVPAVVLTSATLATQRSSQEPRDSTADVARRDTSPYAYLRSRLGLDESLVHVEELVVDSPFDYSSRAMLYTPTDLPAPGSAEYMQAAGARIVELVEIADGGAFVLTTSLRNMSYFAALLRETCEELDILVQGDGAKPRLLQRFRSEGNAVLVATLGFWEGVDVPGEALRLVVLDKIPFAVPSDPIVAARAKEIEKSGGNAFMELLVPAAAITLKQGFGRLIRSRTDYGAVALLDSRVERKSYGHQLTMTLPPATRTRSLVELQKFFARARSDAVTL